MEDEKIWIKIIIGVFIVFLLSMVFNYFVYQQLFLPGLDLNCNEYNSNTWNCGLSGGSQDIINDKVDLSIIYPTNQEIKKDFILSVAQGDLKEFMNTHSEIKKQDFCVRLFTPVDVEVNENDVEVNTYWNTLPVKALKSTTGDSYIKLNWCDAFSQTSLPSMIIVRDDKFNTYGLCENIDNCYFYNPFGSDDMTLTPKSITINFKEGGYLESDSCDVFNICDECVNDIDCGPTVTTPECVDDVIKNVTYKFWCEYSICMGDILYDLIEECDNGCEYSTNKGIDSQGNEYFIPECVGEVVISNQTDYYRYSNSTNTCSITSTDVKTDNDYSSLSECESQIQDTPQNNTIDCYQYSEYGNRCNYR